MLIKIYYEIFFKMIVIYVFIYCIEDFVCDKKFIYDNDGMYVKMRGIVGIIFIFFFIFMVVLKEDDDLIDRILLGLILLMVLVIMVLMRLLFLVEIEVIVVL